MRYLSAISTSTIAGQIDKCVGYGRIRPLASGEDPQNMGGEKFAAIIADHAAQLPSLRHGLPVVLVATLHQEGLRHFRILAEEGIDVRMWTDCGATLSEPTLRCLSSPKAPTPAAPIVHHLRGRFGGLAADVVTATAILATGRRSMDEIALACGASASSVRVALRDEGLISVGGIVARMRALHAVWGWETGQSNFWSRAGFRTLAELSAHLSQHTGSPLGRWRSSGGFNALLHSAALSLHEADGQQEAAAG